MIFTTLGAPTITLVHDQPSRNALNAAGPAEPRGPGAVDPATDLPGTITCAAEAEPLVQLIQQHLPDWRGLPFENPLSLPLWFAALVAAERQCNETERVPIFEAQILRTYSLAREKLSELLVAGPTASAPSAGAIARTAWNPETPFGRLMLARTLTKVPTGEAVDATPVPPPTASPSAQPHPGPAGSSAAPLGSRPVARSGRLALRDFVVGQRGVDLDEDATLPDAIAAQVDPPSSLATSSVDVSTPSDVVSQAVLTAAPQVFSLERMTSGMAAIVYWYLNRASLFKLEGFGSMAEYAERRLGVKGAECQKAYLRAGNAAWTHFPATAQRVLESVTNRVTDVTGAGAPPSLPRVSVLRELPGALRRTHPTTHAALLQRVEAGEVTHQELRSTGRSTPNAPKAPAIGGTVAAHVGTRGTESSSNQRVGRPDVFDDVPELEAAVGHLRAGSELLGKLVQAWTEGPGDDVATLQPVVAVALKAFESLTRQIDDMTPTTVCAACDGKGCRGCSGTGWLPKSGVHPESRPPTRPRTTEKPRAGKPSASRRSQPKTKGPSSQKSNHRIERSAT